MMYRVECPDCGSHDTEQVHVEWMTEMAEEVRICDDCKSQYTNSYNLFDQQIDQRAVSTEDTSE